MPKKANQPLKFNLPRGSGIRIADELGVSRSYVYAVLNGKFYHYNILEAATRILEEAAAERAALAERIKSMSSFIDQNI